MNSAVTRILDYIDGNMSIAESDAFLQELSNDKVLNKQYLYHLNINNALTKLPTVKAPDALMNNIMQSVSKHSFSIANYSAFGGIKFIIALAVVSTTILSFLGFLFSSDVVVAYNTASFSQYIDQFVPNLEMPTGWLAYAPYVCFMLAIPLFAILDSYMKPSMMINRTNK